jgi:hypothetical protein
MLVNVPTIAAAAIMQPIPPVAPQKAAVNPMATPISATVRARFSQHPQRHFFLCFFL